MKRLGLAGLLLCVVVLVSKLFAHSALNDFVVVFTDTDGGGLTGKFSGWVIANPSATGSQTFNLPPAVKGMHFIFALSAPQEIVANPRTLTTSLASAALVPAKRSRATLQTSARPSS